MIKFRLDKAWVDEEVEMHYFHSTLLAAEEMQELQSLLSGFANLSDTPYEGPLDGPQIQIASGPKLVTGGAEAPAVVWAIREKLWHWVRNAPVVYSYTPFIDQPPRSDPWFEQNLRSMQGIEAPEAHLKKRPPPRPTSRPTTRRSRG